MGVTSVIVRPASGLLCRTEKVKALFLLQIAIAVLGIAFLVLPILTSYRLMVVFVVLFGGGEGVLVTCFMVCALKCFSKRVKRNSATGLSTFWASFAVFIGPPLSGIVNSLTNLLVSSGRIVTLGTHRNRYDRIFCLYIHCSEKANLSITPYM